MATPRYFQLKRTMKILQKAHKLRYILLVGWMYSSPRSGWRSSHCHHRSCSTDLHTSLKRTAVGLIPGINMRLATFWKSSGTTIGSMCFNVYPDTFPMDSMCSTTVTALAPHWTTNSAAAYIDFCHVSCAREATQLYTSVRSCKMKSLNIRTKRVIHADCGSGIPFCKKMHHMHSWQ